MAIMPKEIQNASFSQTVFEHNDVPLLEGDQHPLKVVVAQTTSSHFHRGPPPTHNRLYTRYKQIHSTWYNIEI